MLLLRRLLHYGFYLLGGVVIVMSLAALTFKFWFMPNVERFKPDVEASVSRAVGRPVTLGALRAGWFGINPGLTLERLSIRSDQGEPLFLPRVEAVLSWFSLAVLEPRLARVSLEQPDLQARRDKKGVIFVAGIPVNRDATPSPFPDWLLRQSQIIVRDARISWLDEQLEAPEIRLERVRLLLRNQFGRHRFAVVAQPSDAATRVDLRGDLKGESVHRLEEWSGSVYARVDGARFDTWGRWVPWAQKAVRGGTGDLRFWGGIDGAGLKSLRGDARFQGVAVRIQEGLPDLAFQRLDGRAGWERRKDGAHVFEVERLRFSVAGETPSEPASLRVTLHPDGQGGARRVEARAGNLRLEALTALTGALPLPRKGHDLIQALHPRGLVEQAEGHWAGVQDFGFKLRVREAGLNAHESLPGFSGVSARVEATPQRGEAEIQGRDLVLQMDKVFRQPLVFQQLDARVTWADMAGVPKVTLEKAEFHNVDLAGTAQGWIELPPGAKPRVDISGHLSRGQATAVYRYLPRAVADHAHAWLMRGLRGGHSDDTRLVLKGDLARFPFDKGGGEFQVAVRMRDGVLDYAEGWPRIEGVQGMLVFRGQSMTIDASDGRILGARLGPVKVWIPDLHYSHQEDLWVEGRARGPTREFLEFVRRSPIGEHTGGFTEAMNAEGEGDLSLRLHLPLRHLEAAAVNGALRVEGNRLRLGHGLPDLEALSGVVSFTRDGVQARDLRLQVLGMPAVMGFESEHGGMVRARMQGRASAEDLRPRLPAALAARLGGAADWQAKVSLARRRSEIEIASNLEGLEIRLPPPLGKSARDRLPLTIQHQPDETGGSLARARLGDLLALRAEMPAAGPARIALRLSGGEAPEPKAAGVVVTGDLPFLNLDAWRGVDLAPAGQGDGLRILDVDVELGEALAGGYRWHATRVHARPAGRGWNLGLAGREILGDVLLVPEGRGHHVIANLKRLHLMAPEPGTDGGGDAGLEGLLEANVQSLVWHGKELGEARLRMLSEAEAWRLESFSLTTPEARLEGKGALARSARGVTRLNLQLDTGNLGKMLGRLGHHGAIKGGKAKIGGRLGWAGSGDDFRLSALEGELHLELGPGQFLKVEPGAAKLLGILSLQALPRRITLDFRDVFSEGFAFDEIVGDLRIQRGIAHTDNLKMQGPAARVTMSGDIDLAAETQQLRVGIRPRLDETVGMAGALLGGPAVGLGAVIASKLLRDPVGQAIGFEYDVSGTWSEPVVKKLKKKKPEADPLDIFGN